MQTAKTIEGIPLATSPETMPNEAASLASYLESEANNPEKDAVIIGISDAVICAAALRAINSQATKPASL